MIADKTLHVVEWVEDKETFRVITLSIEMAQQAYKDCTRGPHATISGKTELAGAMTHICKMFGMDLEKTREKFTGRGSKEEYLLWTPRGVL